MVAPPTRRFSPPSGAPHPPGASDVAGVRTPPAVHTPPAAPRRGRRHARPHRRPPLGAGIAATILAVAIIAGIAFALPRLARGAPAPQFPGPVTVPTGPAPPVPPAASSAPTTPAATPGGPVLRAPGPVPSRGTGEFTFGAGKGRVLGRSGDLRRFRLAVEKGSGEDVEEFTAVVEATLGDARGWTGDGRTRMQRVPAGSRSDFTIYLATADTAARMCLDGGVDIRLDGRPYTSCRAAEKVILNLDRWRLSVPGYVDARVPLAVYRQYVVNHEVGHQLGHGHERCPARGRPAPVMVQQTLTLQGCEPYAWPRLGGRRYAGAPV